MEVSIDLLDLMNYYLMMMPLLIAVAVVQWYSCYHPSRWSLPIAGVEFEQVGLCCRSLEPTNMVEMQQI